MKKIGLLSAALVLSVTVFAQSETKNQHGVEVSTEAKSTTNIETKGTSVSAVASSKSKSSAHLTLEERAALKAERKALREERKAAKQELKGELNSTVDASKEDIADVKGDLKATVKAEKEASKSITASTRAELKAKRKAARKNAELDLPVKAKGKAAAGADVQLRRPNVKGNLRAGAGLGLL